MTFTLTGIAANGDVTLPIDDREWRMPNGAVARQKDGILDLFGDDANQTADHYSDQWGPNTDFQSFARANPAAMKVTPGLQLGWIDLFERIRAAARHAKTLVYDAACGFGGVLDSLLAEPAPVHLHYLGADIHGSLASIRRPAGVSAGKIHFLRWDIGRTLPVREKFDFVICRAAIHHTPEPKTTFRSLTESVARGGTLAISAYAKKGRVREVVDDALRAEISRMPVDRAKDLVHEFTLLARNVQKTQETITIEQDLPFLGIPSGSYAVHDFIYRFFMKNWYFEAFGSKYSDIVNFDWYHPQFASRHTLDELKSWYEELGFEITVTRSIDAQNYVEGVKVR
jgi:SAM-dependent methyltransferase